MTGSCWRGNGGWVAALAQPDWKKRFYWRKEKVILAVPWLPACYSRILYVSSVSGKGFAHEFVERLIAQAKAAVSFYDLWFNAFVVMNSAAVKTNYF
jgi:hypothetical protein